jgi:hypothetical protein
VIPGSIDTIQISLSHCEFIHHGGMCAFAQNEAFIIAESLSDKTVNSSSAFSGMVIDAKRGVVEGPGLLRFQLSVRL